jgi:hypothetical protein
MSYGDKQCFERQVASMITPEAAKEGARQKCLAPFAYSPPHPFHNHTQE